MAKKSANTPRSDKPKRKPPKTAWKPGQSGNPAGAPKRGESFAEVVKKIGDMTPTDLADHCKQKAAELKRYGDAITMKELFVITAFMGFIRDPMPGMFNAIADRAEGKPIQPMSIDWRQELEHEGMSPEQIDEAFETALAAVNAKLGTDEP